LPKTVSPFAFQKRVSNTCGHLSYPTTTSQFSITRR
jgi:hypothetical protein